MAHSYKTVLKKIILKLGFGFKRDRIEACLGEEIPLELDKKLFEGYIKSEKKKNRKNSFARWSKEDGSEISDSKTIQDDDGSTYTRSDETSYLVHQVENLNNKNTFDAAYEVAVQSMGGNPIYRLIRRGKQQWTIYSENSDNSFRISGENEEDPNEIGDIIKLYRNGIFTAINQTKASCRLKHKTGNFPINEWFTIGSNLAFEKIRDEDGFNKSANNLNLGGSPDGTHMIIPYEGTWDIGYQFVIDLSLDNIQALVEFRVCWGKSPDYQRLKSQFYITNEYYRTIEGSKRLPLNKGDRVFFQIRVNNGNPYLNTFASAQQSEIDNYIGFLYLGF